jgi:hypothetical protein
MDDTLKPPGSLYVIPKRMSATLNDSRARLFRGLLRI